MGRRFGLASIMAVGAALMATNVLAQFAMPPAPALEEMMPQLRRRRGKTRSTGHRPHCNKRGGKSKRLRNLNYWRR